MKFSIIIPTINRFNEEHKKTKLWLIIKDLESMRICELISTYKKLMKNNIRYFWNNNIIELVIELKANSIEFWKCFWKNFSKEFWKFKRNETSYSLFLIISINFIIFCEKIILFYTHNIHIMRDYHLLLFMSSNSYQKINKC